MVSLLAALCLDGPQNKGFKQCQQPIAQFKMSLHEQLLELGDSWSSLGEGIRNNWGVHGERGSWVVDKME